MSARVAINGREFTLSWEEFLKYLDRKPITESVDVIDIIPVKA